MTSVPVVATVPVCRVEDLTPDRGVAALVNHRQVAVFRTAGPNGGTIHAVQQRDPFCGANVLSRGIVGSRVGEPTVSSPMFKQVFSLLTGRCLDPNGRSPVDATGDLIVFDVTIVDGTVLIGPRLGDLT